MTPAPTNTIGLTHTASYSDLWVSSAPLGAQLLIGGVDVTRIEIPNVEDYYYFQGMDHTKAEATDWVAVYDQLPEIMEGRRQ